MKPSRPLPRRGRPVAQDLPARRERLVTVAADVFAREGYSQASFARIAQEAGVSVKTIYAWFDGKAGLFRAVTDHFAQRIEPAARAILRPGAPPEDALRRAAELVLDFALSPQLLAFQRAVVSASAEDPAIGGVYNRSGPMRGYAVLHAYLTEADAAGLLRVPDADAAIDMFLGLVWGDVLRWRLLDVQAPPLTPQQVGDRARRAATLFVALHRPEPNKGN